MKNYYSVIIRLICVVTFISSCKTENKNELTEKTVSVVIREYVDNKLHHTDSTKLTTRETGDVIFNLFGLEKDGEYEKVKDYIFKINPADSSKILIDRVPAKLISEKQYPYQTEHITVRKYYYDVEDEMDEESWVFISNNRIVGFYSKAWNLYRYYKYANSEIDELLEKDTTDFFNYRNKIKE